MRQRTNRTLKPKASPSPIRDLFSMENVFLGIRGTYLGIEPELARVHAFMWLMLFLGSGWAWLVADIGETYRYVSPIKDFFIARQSSYVELHTFFAGAFLVFLTAAPSILAWLGPRFEENGVGVLRIAFWVWNVCDIPTNLGIVDDALTWMDVHGMIYRTLFGIAFYVLFAIIFETVFMVSTWGLLYAVKASFKGVSFSFSLRRRNHEMSTNHHVAELA